VKFLAEQRQEMREV